MTELPVLGLGSEDSRPCTVTWSDGTVVFRGILGDIEEAIAHHKAYEAEQTRKQELRDNGVAVLEDYKHGC